MNLVTVPPEKIANHTAIIAQSGSGKSYFLGRLIEEILLQTKSRCLILDLNGDFLRCNEVVSEDLWTKPTYDPELGLGKLTHEEDRDEFERRWASLQKVVKSASVRSDEEDGSMKRLVLSWHHLSAQLLAADVNPVLRGEFCLCHDFVQTFAKLAKGKLIRKSKSVNLIKEAEALMQRITQSRTTEDAEVLRQQIKNEYDFESLAQERAKSSTEYEVLQEQLNSDDWTVSPEDETYLGFFLDEAKKKTLQELKEHHADDLRKEQENLVHREHQRLEKELDTVFRVPLYVSPEAVRFYFGKARSYMSEGLFLTSINREVKKPYASAREPDLEVIDLSSISNPETRILAVNTLLAAKMNDARNARELAMESAKQQARARERILQELKNVPRAETSGAIAGAATQTAVSTYSEKEQQRDRRTPTFIVVDEAHNLIPGEPQGAGERALLQQFRTIAAEGRKYGLFLILVSQRPDKLDDRIVSECENKVVMKLNSKSVLDVTRRMLGLDDIPEKQLEKCLDFDKGRGLLMGEWCSDPSESILFYVAARRTVEGGGNLDARFWATPRAADDSPPEPSSVKPR